MYLTCTNSRFPAEAQTNERLDQFLQPTINSSAALSLFIRLLRGAHFLLQGRISFDFILVCRQMRPFPYYTLFLERLLTQQNKTSASTDALNLFRPSGSSKGFCSVRKGPDSPAATRVSMETVAECQFH